MEPTGIISGFSQIKLELRTRNKIEKPMQDLSLWFSIKENVLYAHDYDENEKSLAIAILRIRPQSIHCLLKMPGYGNQLLEYIFQLSQEEDVRFDWLINKMYDLYGFRRF